MAATAGVAIGNVNLPAMASTRRTTPAVGGTLAADPNVVYHTGFEDPTDTSWLFSYVSEAGVTVPVTSYDTTNPHVGQRCLKYSRPAGTIDAKTGKLPYVIAAKTIPSEVSGEYEATVFVRSEGLSSASEYYGARLALQTYNADGRWVATYPSGGYMGSTWSMMTTRTPPLSANEVRLEVILYLYRDRTGTLWFDELTVSNVSPPPMSVLLHYPAYRGLIIPGDGDDVELDVHLNPDKVSFADHAVRLTIATESGTQLWTKTLTAAETVHVTEPVSGLPATPMRLTVDLVDTSSDSIVDTNGWELEKLTAVPTNYLDRHGRFIRNGEPYFPMGMFASDLHDTATRYENGPGSPALPKAELSRLAGTPFNVLMAYSPPDGADLDHAHAHGISVVYAINSFFYDAAGKYHWPPGAVIENEDDEIRVITETVNTYKSHPAMLGWYLSDELNVDFFGQRLIAHHEAVARNDPMHPTMNVNPHVLSPETFLRCGDVLGVDNYPIYGRSTDDISRPGRLARTVREALPRKGMWHVAQGLDWRFYTTPEAETPDDRPPTRDELRCMYWQFVIAGATGLFLYQFPLMNDQLLADAAAVCSQISGQLPVIMSVEPTRPITGTVGDTIDWTVRERAGNGYVIAVSTDSATQTATFTAEWAMTATEVFTNQTIALDSTGTLSDTFAPIGVRMYRLTPPTFDSLAELTEAELLQSGDSSARGVATATTKILGRAKTKANGGDVEAHLDDYRDLIRSREGTLLTTESADNLIRLSNALA